MKVRDVMSTHVSYADLNSSITDVAKKMRDLNVGSIPICDQQQHPIGIVTDRDIVIRGVVEGVQGNEKVSKVMSGELISISPDMHVHEAARLMGDNQIRRLPVVENGRIVGMVAIGDLAVQNIYEDEAGKALSNISTPSRPMM
ncbi:CBS domain-containing protein [Alkaliphilus serpentinus]|uniref:CBS domain-containing protein n=1 Tax=Alkaliphilus serpentinus TaxID=1482731 RepID=A0A833MCH3_9FIRM|nr:CBS domain-containing protein [Alkaliphilus serpentinus]KAB3525450.1 CBS domain-containing protein [Alkaliphilus serpentinus]